jgi:hypothetical protein
MTLDLRNISVFGINFRLHPHACWMDISTSLECYVTISTPLTDKNIEIRSLLPMLYCQRERGIRGDEAQSAITCQYRIRPFSLYR